VDRIIVEAIEFYGYHGAFYEEQVVGHRYAVDVELRVDTQAAAASDSLPDTVNYAEVARRIIEVGTREQFRLLEALAERMAAVVLKEFEMDSVRIRVSKLHPPMDSIAARVSVDIERMR
jgi:dihydroneopterin aldolase